jgi:hypothetical protein
MFVIAVDFDGTLCDHTFPDIGKEVPYAFAGLRSLQAIEGVRLMLWTMRSDMPGERATLTEAVEWCRERGIEFWGVNENPEQRSWSVSNKQYAKAYIDDAAVGCPLVHPPGFRGQVVDWEKVMARLCRMHGF